MEWSELAQKLVQEHNGEVLILALTLILVLSFLAVFPFLLRNNQRKAEMLHREHLQALEKGQPLPVEDYRARAAGRTALFVPIIGMLSAAGVTCFLVSTHTEYVFAVSLAVWVVAGTVSLTAITGGVALIGRLAQIQARQEDDEEVVEEDQYTP
jgi:NhaP-type Na+/H+ or K+/H+ antiporter